MAGFTQDNRLLKMTTPLGRDALLIESFTVSERVSDPFEIEIEALTEAGTAIDPKQLLGKSVTVTVALDMETEAVRHFNGIVREFHFGAQSERFQGYRLSVVPSLWLLSLSQNFRVFEKMSVPDILSSIFGQYRISYSLRLNRAYTLWDMCTQYKESDLHFVSRLMEHEGIFYFFEHSEGAHKLILADSPQALQTCPQQESFNYAPEVGTGAQDWVSDWVFAHQLRSGSYRLWDWHMENASRFEATDRTADPVAGNPDYKVSDFTGQFTHQFNAINGSSKVPGEKAILTKLRMEEVETENPLYRGSGTLRALSSGQRFNLQGLTVQGEFAVTSAEHRGVQHPPYLYGAFETPLSYNTVVACIKHGTVYRPVRKHRKPVVQGPQTAIVTDRPDKYGRVRVKYHWGDPQSPSAWVRVVQKWAGPTYGALFIPRPDHEVVVEFIDGDPDQPIITGCVYSATNMPPYSLPDDYTQSGIKTRSVASQDGGAEEFNELRFEDKQGSEDIYFHAQKDFHRVVENDDDLKVGHDQTIEIKNSRTEVVKDGDEKVTIEKGKREIFVDMGNDLHQVKQGNRDAKIDMGNDSIKIAMGNHIRKIDLGKSETEAMQSIELKVGQSSIKIDQTGVTIKGMMITCDATVKMEQKAVLHKTSGTAMVQIQGGITMIN